TLARAYPGKLLSFDSQSGSLTVGYVDEFDSKTDFAWELATERDLTLPATVISTCVEDVAAMANPVRTMEIVPQSPSAGKRQILAWLEYKVESSSYDLESVGRAKMKWPPLAAKGSRDASSLVITKEGKLWGFVNNPEHDTELSKAGPLKISDNLS